MYFAMNFNVSLILWMSYMYVLICPQVLNRSTATQMEEETKLWYENYAIHPSSGI